MRAKKSLGQNFLMHSATARRIVSAAECEGKVVLEVGPGTGMLTRELLRVAKKVIAVEADAALVAQMEKEFAPEITEKRLVLVHRDIRTFDLATLPKKYAVVANIPYYITGELIRTFLEAQNQPSAMTLLVQKEVADRIIARGGKESILSLSVKAYGTPNRAFLVPRGAFIPAPAVDSAVLTIRDISRKNFKTQKEEKKFFNMLHAGFAHKRKLVQNNLAEAGFSTSNIPDKARAEDLTLEEWFRIARDA